MLYEAICAFVQKRIVKVVGPGIAKGSSEGPSIDSRVKGRDAQPRLIGELPR